MRETGILSIVRRGYISQVRYASFNPYDMDRLPYQCSNETALVALLHHWGIDTWSLQQAIAALRKGEVAVLCVALSEAQLQAYFPPQHAPRVCREARDEGGQTHPPAPNDSTGCNRLGTWAAPALSSSAQQHPYVTLSAHGWQR
jgi:hypothetical protein